MIFDAMHNRLLIIRGMLHLTLRQLQVFESAARHLSLSRAAEELHLSQPGVSMQMKKLSEAVGQPLMEQNGKRVQLTDQGQELVAAAREILGALKRFELSLVARQGLTKATCAWWPSPPPPISCRACWGSSPNCIPA
jgi:DNA-binding MarR family transcriptional regulator